MKIVKTDHRGLAEVFLPAAQNDNHCKCHQASKHAESVASFNNAQPTKRKSYLLGKGERRDPCLPQKNEHFETGGVSNEKQT